MSSSSRSRSPRREERQDQSLITRELDEMRHKLALSAAKIEDLENSIKVLVTMLHERDKRADQVQEDLLKVCPESLSLVKNCIKIVDKMNAAKGEQLQKGGSEILPNEQEKERHDDAAAMADAVNTNS